MSTDECRFSLEKHSCVSGSRPVEFHYHCLTTRTACGLHAERDVASCRVPTGCYSLGSNRIWCFPSVKSIRHAGRYSFSGLRGVVAVVVHARARMASSNLGFFTIPSLFADTWNWLLSFVLMHLGYIWDIFGNCKDLSFLLLELIEKKFSLIVGAGVGS